MQRAKFVGFISIFSYFTKLAKLRIRRANLFISIEGGEGVGKSNFTENLVNYLKSHFKKQVFKTREPGGSPTAEKIRSIFNDPVDGDPLRSMTELFLISASRYQHVDAHIIPRLKAGEWVVCDRFSDSTRVYQGELGGIDDSVLEPIIAISTKNLNPDITFLLDCKSEVVLQRLNKRCPSLNTGATRYDKVDLQTHEKLRHAYLNLAHKFPQRIKIIDAEKTPAMILEEAKKTLKEYL